MTTVKETTDCCDIDKVKIGDVWTRHDSGKIIGIRGHKIDVKNDAGDEWELTDQLVEKQFSFANQHDEVVKVSRTEMINLLKSKRQTAMTIAFFKKPDPGVVAKELAAGQGAATDRQWKSIVKTLITGESRIMIGHHDGVFDDHERLRFKEHGKGARLVDTRTLTSMVVGRTSYMLK